MTMQDPLTPEEREVCGEVYTETPIGSWFACSDPKARKFEGKPYHSFVPAVVAEEEVEDAIRRQRAYFEERAAATSRDPDTSAAVTHTLADLDKPSPLRHA